jgi:hypothetical protein
MRNVLSLILFLAVTAVMANQLTAPTTYGTFGAWKFDRKITMQDDSSYGLADSITVCTKNGIADNSEWAVYASISTTAGDSIGCYYKLYDVDGNLIKQGPWDTIHPSATSFVGALPVGNTVLGSQITLYFRGYVAAVAHKIKRLEFWKRTRNP